MFHHEAKIHPAFRPLVADLARARKAGRELRLGVGERPFLEQQLWVLVTHRPLLEDHHFFLRDELGIRLKEFKSLGQELIGVVLREHRRGFHYFMDIKLAECTLNMRALAALYRELKAQRRHSRRRKFARA